MSNLTRTQVYFCPDNLKKPQKKLARTDTSLAQYIRDLIHQDIINHKNEHKSKKQRILT